MCRDRCSIIRVFLSSAQQNCYEFNRQLFSFLIIRTDWTFCKKVCGVHSIESHANYYIFFVYVYPKLQLLSSFSKISSTPCSVDEHGVSIDAFAIRIEPPSQGRYLMKRQSHLRIAISNSARQRRTRGRVGGRSRGRGRRSRDKIIKTPLPRFVLKR